MSRRTAISRQGLEYALYLVVLVLSLGLDVKVHAGSIAQALKEVQEHLRRHLAYLFAMELCIPYQPGPATEIQTCRT